MNVRDETRRDKHKSAALRYALLCIVTRLISDVHFYITGPKLTLNSLVTISLIFNIPVRTRGFKSRMCPPYPHACRIRRLKWGAVI